MIKKWWTTIQVAILTTTLILYFTIGILTTQNARTIKEKKQDFYSTEGSHSIKTILGFSLEYEVIQELKESVLCEWNKTDINEWNEKQNNTTKWLLDSEIGNMLQPAYYDRRQQPYHYLRIIGLLTKNIQLFCQLWYRRGETVFSISSPARIHYIWSENWGQGSEENVYPSLVSCLIPPKDYIFQPPEKVSLTRTTCSKSKIRLNVQSEERKSPKKDFVVCVKPLSIDKLLGNSLEEWLRLVTILGASKIDVYVAESSETDIRKLGNVEVIPFKVPENSKNEIEVWWKRKIEILAYNDCFYRNFYQSRFVVPLDVDEIIIPLIEPTWSDMFQIHIDVLFQQYASYSVRNVYFFSEYPSTAVMIPTTQQRPTLVNIGVFNRTIRSYYFSPGTDSVKSFLNVKNTLTVFNHYAFNTINNARRQYIFPTTIAQLNHYRNNCDTMLIDGCRNFLDFVTVDNSIENFLQQIKN